jgi:hypothetical protein
MGQRLDDERAAHSELEAAGGAVDARDDVYLSTLISYVRALGGDLRIEAVFPGEESIEIRLDEELEEQNVRVTSVSG